MHDNSMEEFADRFWGSRQEEDGECLKVGWQSNLGDEGTTSTGE